MTVPEFRPVQRGWWEQYKCGCVSATVARKRDLLGYCPQHGDGSRGAERDIEWVADHSDDSYRGPRGREADYASRHQMNEARKLK